MRYQIHVRIRELIAIIEWVFEFGKDISVLNYRGERLKRLLKRLRNTRASNVYILVIEFDHEEDIVEFQLKFDLLPDETFR